MLYSCRSSGNHLVVFFCLKAYFSLWPENLVAREELVVEKKVIGNQQEFETARIPLREENIEVKKHPKQLNDVTISEKEYAESEAVEETLKKERLTIDSKGDVKTRDK